MIPTTQTAALLLLVSCLVSDGAATEKIDGDTLLSPNHVTKIEIRIDDDDWAKLCRESPGGGEFSGISTNTEYTYFKADIAIDGN